MAEFQITGPDGKKYRIQGETPEGAIAALKKMLAVPGVAAPPPVQAPLNEDDRETRATNPGVIPGTGLLPIGRRKGTGEVVFPYLGGGVIGSTLDVIGKNAANMKGVVEGTVDPLSQEAVMAGAEGAALMTPISAASRVAETVVPGTLRSVRPGPVKIPTTQELKKAGSAGFDQARELGVDYSTASVNSLADDLLRQLDEAGFSGGPEGVSPKTFSVLSALQKPPDLGPDDLGAVFSVKNLITARKRLQKVQKEGKGGEESEAARRAIDALDDFVMAPPAESVVAGPAASVGKLVDDARGDYAAHFRSKDVEKSIRKAEQDASTTPFGLNEGKRISDRLKSLLQDEKRTRGYTKEEVELLEAAVAGKFGAKLSRYVSNMLSAGGGWGQTGVSLGGGGLAYLLGGPQLAAATALGVPIAGAGLRVLSNKLMKRGAQGLAAGLRKRSPLYQKALERPPLMSNLRPEIRNAVNMGLMFNALPPIATPESAAEIARRTGIY